jgi:hypothetical protein
MRGERSAGGDVQLAAAVSCQRIKIHSALGFWTLVIQEAAKAERCRDDTLVAKTSRYAGQVSVLVWTVGAGKPARIVRLVPKREAEVSP